MFYTILRFLQFVLLYTPRFALLSLSTVIGEFIFLNRRRRSAAFKNVKTAFTEQSDSFNLRIVRKHFHTLVLSGIESLIAGRIYKHVEIVGLEKITSNGGICVGIHAGSWEVINARFGQAFAYAVMAEPQKRKGLQAFLEKQRKSAGIHICYSLRETIRALKQNYLIGMVVDQGLERDALMVPFFSHLVATPRGAVYLARKFNKKIYPCFTYRGKGFSQKVVIGEGLNVGTRSDHEVLGCLNQMYEDYLRKNPFEYFWSHKRFKYKQNRHVVILDDGKAGHLKQSRALASTLVGRGYTITQETVGIQYRWEKMRPLADLLAQLAPLHDVSSMRWLTLLLQNDSLKPLRATLADIVISSGSFLAPINKLFSSYCGAKSAVILKPNISLNKFTYSVIPEHDRIQGVNTTLIKGALVAQLDVTMKMDECKKFFNITHGANVSVFIGGPLQDAPVFFERVTSFIERVKEFVVQNNYGLLISTSRRTPAVLEEQLESKLGSFAPLKAMVFPNRLNYDFVFEGFCGLSDIIFVSADSISMVSETASISASCVCTFFEDPDHKRILFLETVAGEISTMDAPYDFENLKIRPSNLGALNKQRLDRSIGVLF